MNRFSALLLAAALAAPFTTVAQTALAAEQGSKSTQRFAVIHVEVRETNGTVVRAPVKVVPEGKSLALALEGQHKHEFELKTAPDNKLVFNYTRDGNTVSTNAAIVGDGHTYRHTDGGTLVTIKVNTTVARIKH